MEELGRPRAKPEYVRFEPKQAPPAAPAPSAPKSAPKSGPGAPVPAPRGMAGPLLIVGALVAVLAAGVVWGLRRQPDPHYVRARDMVARYELGRDPGELNYHNKVYDRALDELELVAPESISAAPARELAEDIEARRVAFRDRLTASAARHDANRERRAERLRNHTEHVAQDIANPRTEFPECDE